MSQDGMIIFTFRKRRYHNRRIQRDVIKSRKPLIGDSMGHTPPYTHRHSGKSINTTDSADHTLIVCFYFAAWAPQSFIQQLLLFSAFSWSGQLTRGTHQRGRGGRWRWGGGWGWRYGLWWSGGGVQRARRKGWKFPSSGGRTSQPGGTFSFALVRVWWNGLRPGA